MAAGRAPAGPGRDGEAGHGGGERAHRGLRAAGGRAAPGRALVPVGAVCQRAPVGDRPRGLQRGRRGLDLPAARPRPVARLPVGGGRPGRVLRHRAAAVPGAGAVERPGPDPQGAGLRADRRGGQPRGGRQGVLVVPGRPAQPCLEPLALPLPAGGVPLSGPDRGERQAQQVRPGVRAARHRRVRPGPLLDHRGLLRQGGPRRPADGHHRDQRRAHRRHPAPAAHRLVPQHLVLGSGCAQAGHRGGRGNVGPDRAPLPRHPRTARGQRAGRHRARAAVL